jgi:UDP-N-acetylglucosamine 1-carboxyvinyltransferase
MDRFLIRGGVPLHGKIRVSGSKNAALPALAAILLTDKKVVLERVPDVWDIGTMLRLLRHLGVETTRDRGKIAFSAAKLTSQEAPYEIVKTMRASSLVLGPLVARTGRARVSVPGGCAIGARPIDLHLKGLEKLGATISQEHGYIEARADNGLKGATIHFDRITVTGTEDLMMAAVLAKGETVIENAAREPEVQDLALLLNKMGARVQGAGTSVIRIRGVARMHGGHHSVIPDRIEAGTLLVAGAITGGDLLLEHCRPDHLSSVVFKLQEAGVEVTSPKPTSLRVRAAQGPLQALDMSTEEYPGFPTDMQAQYMALMTQASGISVIAENIFENRFMHVQELARMGAQIQVQGRRAIIRGESPLSGAAVMASDLRASASLVLAGLVAQGETTIERVYHIDRGYENIEARLAAVGARITRVSGE